MSSEIIPSKIIPLDQIDPKEAREYSTSRKRELLIQYRAQGWSYSRIAQALGVARSTIGNWAAELEAEIAQARALELEALQEEYYLLKAGRIEMLGGLLNELKAELQARDLSEISTDKLIELLLKVWSELKSEYVEVKPISDQQAAEISEWTESVQMSSKQIAGELQALWKRYQLGLLSEQEARQQAQILQLMLKAYEQAEIENKLEAIQAVLEERIEW